MYRVDHYQSNLESQWVVLRARVVARSHTWDFVERQKVKYENPSIELVLFNGEQLIGYIDAETEVVQGQLCWKNESKGALVQEFGIAPEFQKKGLSKLLLNALKDKLIEKNIRRVEFWTKDPKSTKYYQHLGFEEIFLHEHYRVEAHKFLQRNRNLPFNAEYGYFIQNANTPLPDAIRRTPLEPHTCYGFEWHF